MNDPQVTYEELPMPRVADPLARSRLLRAAREVFAKVGLSEARVEEIARRAGLSKGAFYLHFKSKDAAVVAVVDHFFAEVIRLTERCSPDLEAAQHVDEVRPSLAAQDCALFEFAWDNRDLLEILESASGLPQFAHLKPLYIEGNVQRIIPQIALLQRHGVYRDDLDPEVVARCLVGAYENLARQMIRMKSRPNISRWVDSVLTLFLDGLCPGPRMNLTRESVTIGSQEGKTS
ncbi:MAG: TetR/AcrR family transcriptional regulator [Bradymonadia bacterium]